MDAVFPSIVRRVRFPLEVTSAGSMGRKDSLALAFRTRVSVGTWYVPTSHVKRQVFNDD